MMKSGIMSRKTNHSGGVCEKLKCRNYKYYPYIVLKILFPLVIDERKNRRGSGISRINVLFKYNKRASQIMNILHSSHLLLKS